jgi:hypothetical protein
MQRSLQVFFFVSVLTLQYAKATGGSIDLSSPPTQENPSENPLAMPPDTSESATSLDMVTTKKVADTPNSSSNELTAETKSPVQKKYVRPEDRTALRGVWLGAALSSQNFSSTAKGTISGTEREIKSTTANYQNAGFTAKYSHMPYNSVGTDISGTVSTSLNHGSLNSSAITSVNLQLNLTYAVSSENPYYLFGGFGYEVLSGKDIVRVVSPNGAALQGGGGIVLGKSYNLEGYYQVTRHKVSSDYLDQLTNYFTAQGASSVSFDSSSEATSSILVARLTYRY